MGYEMRSELIQLEILKSKAGGLAKGPGTSGIAAVATVKLENVVWALVRSELPLHGLTRQRHECVAMTNEFSVV